MLLPSSWSPVALQLLLISVLVFAAAADQCSSEDGPACGNWYCPYGACLSCYEVNGMAQPTCANNGAAGGAAALAGGLIAVVVLVPLIGFCVIVSIVVCCVRGLCCFQGSRMSQRWGGGVVYSSGGAVAMYGRSGPTVVMQMASPQAQPMYVQPGNAVQAQPIAFAGPMQPQYAQQPSAQYSPRAQYAAPQQQYSYQPQPASYPPQQQQWQQDNQPPPYPSLAQYPPTQQQQEWPAVEKPGR